MTFLFLLLTSFSFSSSYKLDDLYREALQKKEFASINKSILQAQESRRDQAFSFLYPNISANAVYDKSEFHFDSSSGKTEDEFSNIGLNLKQNLFKGGLVSGVKRENRAMELSKNEVNQRNLNLYEVVAMSYYKILTTENFLEVLKELESVSNKRVSILKKRVGIGRSKKTDLLTNEVQNQNLKFEIETTQVELKNEREKLANLTNLPNDMRLTSDESVPQVKTLEYYLSKSESNPDVQVQKTKTLIAELDETIFTNQHLPTLTLDLDIKDGEFTSDIKGTEYSGTLNLKVPLYEGGGTSAKAQEAKWNRIQQRSKLTQSLKDNATEIKNEYENLQKWLRLLKLSEETLKTAERNYKLFNRELELGLTSNLELLNSINTFLETKKNRDEAYYQLKLSEIRLSRLVGETRLQ